MKTAPSRVEIEARDGPSAFALERRLAYLSPTTVERNGRWLVEVDGGEALDEIEGAVARWLRDIDEPSTSIRLDGRRLTIDSHARHLVDHTRATRRQPPVSHRFIG